MTFNEIYDEMIEIVQEQEQVPYSDTYEEPLPDTEEFQSFQIAVATMTHDEMIDWVTDLYVTKLEPVNYQAVEMEDFPCEKDAVIEKVYTYF